MSDIFSKDRRMAEYSVGPLLYMPALRKDIAAKLTGMDMRSAAICLEDTIRDDMVIQAEDNLAQQLKMISANDRLPKIFIRVRDTEQTERLFEKLGESISLVTGIIIPKVDDETIIPYLENETLMNSGLYLMPIIEHPSMLKLSSRYNKLERLYDSLMQIRNRVLNVRIGGNDFCRVLSLRADIDETVYDILPVGRLISDIAAVFADEFTVSAPVWNYFEGSGRDWRSGMIREMKTDRAIGLIGKTVIHPSQIALVNEAMKVSRTDYEDAKLITETDNDIQVVKSTDGGRMYENKIHTGWAEKVLCLAEIYGVRE